MIDWEKMEQFEFLGKRRFNVDKILIEVFDDHRC